MFKFSFASAFACALGLLCPITIDAQIRSDSQVLSEVEVSAPKFPQKINQTGKVLTIISQEQIQLAFGKNLGELLQEQVGVSIVGARSAQGTNQEVYVRGSNTGHVLVLMDGFPINDPSHISQVWDWNLISLSSLERIEILKGGQSTLYGSDAMAAVINLVTKKSDVQRLQSSIEVLVGAFGTYSPQVQLRGKIQKWQWNLTAKDYFTSGFSAAKVIGGGEKDGFHQQNIDLSVSRPLGRKSWLDIYYQFQNYRGNLDAGPFTDELDYISKAHSNSIRLQFQTKIKSADIYVRAFTDQINRLFRNDSTFIPNNAFSNFYESNYQGLSRGLELYAKVPLGNEIIGIIGAELRNQTTDQSDFSISSYGRYDSPRIEAPLANQSIFAAYGLLQKNWNEKMGLEVGTRWNHSITFGNFMSFNVNPYWYYRPNLKLFVNVSSGFKVPSLYQLYSPYGNLNLMAEKGMSYEMGWEHTIGNSKLRGVFFENRVKDGIVFQSTDVEPYGQYVNVSQQNTRGAEAEFSFQQKKWSSQLNYTYLTGQISTLVGSKDSTYSSLIRRPKHNVSFRITYQWSQKWRLSLLNQWIDTRMDYVYDDQTFAVVAKSLNAYLWTDLQVSFQWNKKCRLGFLLKNVFNQEIEELYGYNGQIRNWQLNVGFRF
jgi:vitamin B12 transporter